MKREENAVAAAVIALGLGVALGCQILGGPLPPALPEAGAAPVNGVVEQNAFEDYQQLSDPLLVLVNGQVPLPEDWAFTPFLVDDQVVDSRMREDLSALLAPRRRRTSGCGRLPATGARSGSNLFWTGRFNRTARRGWTPLRPWGTPCGPSPCPATASTRPAWPWTSMMFLGILL